MIPRSPSRRALLAAIPALGFGLPMLSLGRPSRARAAVEGRVVPYVSLDREFSEPILNDFQKQAGIQVVAKYDVESTKTVGLTNRILAEARRPVADLFWNNEILNTMRLQRAGLLVPFEPTHAADIPASFRARDGSWYGFAGRARILIVNTNLVPDAERPQGIQDLTLERWKGQTGFAKPLFGTTATHAACLYQVWGDDRAQKYFRDLKANDVAVLAGNKQVAIEVASGRLAFGMTDTDDAMVMKAQGAPIEIIYPDRQPDQLGTLFIPNTIALIKNGPNPNEARKLASALLSPEVEARLADGPSAQIPLLDSTKAPSRVETPRTVQAMNVDFEAAAALWDRAAEFLSREFR